MRFEDRRFEQNRDQALGKPPGASSVPWIASPASSSLTNLRLKARAVLDGTATYSREEIQTLLASLVLSDG